MGLFRAKKAHEDPRLAGLFAQLDGKVASLPDVSASGVPLDKVQIQNDVRLIADFMLTRAGKWASDNGGFVMLGFLLELLKLGSIPEEKIEEVAATQVETSIAVHAVRTSMLRYEKYHAERALSRLALTQMAVLEANEKYEQVMNATGDYARRVKDAASQRPN